MIGVTGFDAFAAHLESTLLTGLHRAAAGEAEQEIAAAQATKGQALVGEMFAAKIDPQGYPWAPQKHDYGNPLMVRSGDLAASEVCAATNVSASGHDITFTVSDFKAPFHQYGTPRMVARPVLFEGDDSRWRGELDIVGQAALDRWMTAEIHS